MKHITLIIILMLSLSLAYASSPIGLTLRMRGSVSLSRDEINNPLSEGESLYNQDLLRSFENSFAFIKFVDDGATLRLFENSILSISTEPEETKLNKNNYLQVGSVFTSVRRNSGDLTIETPTTVASVKGTEGIVSVDEDGKTEVIVIKGSFEVYNKETGESITVTAGNTGSSNGSGALDSYPSDDIDPDILDDIKDDSIEETDRIRIEMLREDGQRRTIEIELE